MHVRSAPASPFAQPRAWLAVALATVAGDVAITFFLVAERSITAGLAPLTCLLQLLQWDASNAYGDAAFSEGWNAALVGQAFDLAVSFAWALGFVALAVRLPVLRGRPWIAGCAYGVVVMVVMLDLLVPLGHAHAMRASTVNFVRVLVAHTLFFGVPVALVTSRLLPAP